MDIVQLLRIIFNSILLNFENILHFLLYFIGSFIILSFEPNYMDTIGLILIVIARLISLRIFFK